MNIVVREENTLQEALVSVGTWTPL